MDFRTTLKPHDNMGIMHHSDALMLLGSCFSDNIGRRLHDAMVRVSVNPMGTLYNPLSISQAVERIISCERERGIDLFEAGGVWNSFNFHSSFSLPDKMLTLERMNQSISDAHEVLRQCSCIIITLGTAVVYRLKSTGQVVANCHKVPQHQFTRRMAGVDEIAETLSGMVSELHAFNPELRIIFTVSPIRHIADGLEVNSLSKATLRVAIGQVMKVHPECTLYFPAFEIMTDDLRDYRFYAPDMVHPSEVAIEYIWQAFEAQYFDDASCQAIARCERVSKRLHHRPMSKSQEAVERFNADTRQVIRNLVAQYPYIIKIKEINNLI